MGHAKEILDELRQPVRELRDQIPAVFEGYGALSTAAFADGAYSWLVRARSSTCTIRWMCTVRPGYQPG